MILQFEKERVRNLARALNMRSMAIAINNGDIEDLQDQFSRITVLIWSFAPLMNYYVKCLGKAQNPFDALEAYAFGKSARQDGLTEREAVYGYLRSCHELQENIKNKHLLNSLHKMISFLLGSNCYLINDFPSEYHKITSTSQWIDRFVRMGYAAP